MLKYFGAYKAECERVSFIFWADVLLSAYYMKNMVLDTEAVRMKKTKSVRNSHCNVGDRYMKNNVKKCQVCDRALLLISL